MVTHEEGVHYSFTADNKSLVTAVEQNIDLLSRYGKQIKQLAAQDLAATEQEMKTLSKSISSVTSVATQMTKVFADFHRQVEKYSTGFNWMDEAIRKQEKLTKSAKESASIFEDARRTQNVNNAKSGGVVRVDEPTKSAKESASIFEQYFASADTKLGSVLNKLGVGNNEIVSMVSNVAKLGSKVSKVVAVTQAVFSVLKRVAPIVLNITKAVTQFVMTPLRIMQTTFAHLKESLVGTNGALSNFANILGISAGAGLGSLMSKVAQDAADMAEAMNLFNVVMAKDIDTGNLWITTLSEMSGMDKTNLMGITGLFYEMGAAIEMPHDAATKLSKDLTTLSLDISSLFNVDLEKVTSNMTSGIRGMSRAVVKYGMDLRATTIEAFAKTKFGITEQYETMNETNRIILRYLAMLEQAQDAQGDFAATVKSPANQLRIFKEQVLGVSRELGRFVVHVLEPALPVMNGIAMALRNMLQYVADFMGIWKGLDSASGRENVEETSDAVDGLGDSATSAAKAVKNLLAPFDELNILKDYASSSSDPLDYGEADPVLLQALKDAEAGFGRVEMAAHKTRDAVLKFFGFEYVFDPNDELGAIIRKIPGEFADNLQKAFEAQNFTGVGNILATKLNSVADRVAQALSWDTNAPSIKKSITNLADGIGSFVDTFNWTTIGTIFGNVLKTTFETINFAAITFDWSGLGSALSESLNGFFLAFDLTTLGRTFANVLEAIADFAAGAATTFNWEEFGEQLSDSINTFFHDMDAKKLGKAANSIISSLFLMINTAVKNTDWKLIGTRISEFLDALDWNEIFKMLGRTVWEALKGSVTAAFYASPIPRVQQIMQGTRNDAGQYTVFGGGYGTHTPFATGGVVTGPTRALIGEAGRAEAVIPLDNSPQMNELVNKIASAVSGNNRPMEVHVYLDNQEVAYGLYDELENVRATRGGAFVR